MIKTIIGNIIKKIMNNIRKSRHLFLVGLPFVDQIERGFLANLSFYQLERSFKPKVFRNSQVRENLIRDRYVKSALTYTSSIAYKSHAHLAKIERNRCERTDRCCHDLFLRVLYKRIKIFEKSSCLCDNALVYAKTF